LLAAPYLEPGLQVSQIFLVRSGQCSHLPGIQMTDINSNPGH
jgi:hypothetical protein